MHNKHTIT